MRPIRTSYIAVALAAAVGGRGTAQAQTLGVTPSGSAGTLSTGLAYTEGFAFNVTAPVTVAYLGFWAGATGTLRFSHQVGLWAADGTLLASAVVPAGTAEILVGSFRLVALPTPVTLGAGWGYTVGGYNPQGGDETLDAAGIGETAPGVQFLETRYLTDGYGMPTSRVAGRQAGYYGGNFAVGPLAVVPEPGTTALVGAGLLLAGVGARGRARALTRRGC